MAGRPLKFDRQACLQIAMQEFWKHGYANVTVNGLSEKFGIKRSSFYHSFGSLDALFGEVVTLYMSGAPVTRIASDDDVSNDYSPSEQIRMAFKALCKMRACDKEKKGCLLVNSIGVYETLSPEARKITLRGVQNGMKQLNKLVIEAVEAGELAADCDVQTLQAALQTLTMGLNNVSKVIASEQELWNIAQATLDGLGFVSRSEPAC